MSRTAPSLRTAAETVLGEMDRTGDAHHSTVRMWAATLRAALSVPATGPEGLDEERLRRIAATPSSRLRSADRTWLHDIGGGIDFIEGRDFDVDERAYAAFLGRLAALRGSR